MPMETTKEKNSWLIASSKICKNHWRVTPLKIGYDVVQKALKARARHAVCSRVLSVCE